MPRKKYPRPYFERNKHFSFYAPETLANDIISYLHEYSIGDNLSEMMRVFWAKILEQNRQGINIANPRAEYELQRRQRLKSKFGNVEEVAHICLRDVNMKTKTPSERDIVCTYCQAGHKDIFKACQQVKGEFLEADETLRRK